MSSGLIHNTKFQGWLALISFLSGILFWYYGRNVKSISYAVSPTTTIANKAHKNKLTIAWDGIELQNARVCKVLVWNSGSSFIDRTDFSTTSPPFIAGRGAKVRLLAASVEGRSRSTLSVQPLIKDNRIYFDIVGDDGLEKDDFFIFDIVYTSDTIPSWFAQGRVKGIPSGFTKVDEKEFEAKLKKSGWIGILVNSALVLFFGWYVIKRLLKIGNDIEFFQETWKAGKRTAAVVWGAIRLAIAGALFYYAAEFFAGYYRVMTMPAIW